MVKQLEAHEFSASHNPPRQHLSVGNVQWRFLAPESPLARFICRVPAGHEKPRINKAPDAPVNGRRDTERFGAFVEPRP